MIIIYILNILFGLILFFILYELIIHPIYLLLGGNLSNYDKLSKFNYERFYDIRDEEYFSCFNIEFITSDILDIRENGLSPVKIFNKKSNIFVGISSLFLELCEIENLVLIAKYCLIFNFVKNQKYVIYLKYAYLTFNFILVYLVLTNCEKNFMFLFLSVFYLLLNFLLYILYRFVLIPYIMSRELLVNEINNENLSMIFETLLQFQNRNSDKIVNYDEDIEYIMLMKFMEKK